MDVFKIVDDVVDKNLSKIQNESNLGGYHDNFRDYLSDILKDAY